MFLELSQTVLQVDAEAVEVDSFVLAEEIVASRQGQSILEDDADFGVEVVAEALTAVSSKSIGNRVVDVAQTTANCPVRSSGGLGIAKRADDAVRCGGHEQGITVGTLARDVKVRSELASPCLVHVHASSTEAEP